MQVRFVHLLMNCVSSQKKSFGRPTIGAVHSLKVVGNREDVLKREQHVGFCFLEATRHIIFEHVVVSHLGLGPVHRDARISSDFSWMMGVVAPAKASRVSLRCLFVEAASIFEM